MAQKTISIAIADPVTV